MHKAMHTPHTEVSLKFVIMATQHYRNTLRLQTQSYRPASRQARCTRCAEQLFPQRSRNDCDFWVPTIQSSGGRPAAVDTLTPSPNVAAQEAASCDSWVLCAAHDSLHETVGRPVVRWTLILVVHRLCSHVAMQPQHLTAFRRMANRNAHVHLPQHLQDI